MDQPPARLLIEFKERRRPLIELAAFCVQGGRRSRFNVAPHARPNTRLPITQPLLSRNTRTHPVGSPVRSSRKSQTKPGARTSPCFNEWWNRTTLSSGTSRRREWKKVAPNVPSTGLLARQMPNDIDASLSAVNGLRLARGGPNKSSCRCWAALVDTFDILIVGGHCHAARLRS
jgi:hypothetical protein